MKTITTESGFKCKVNEDQLDDMRLFDALIDMDAPTATPFQKLHAVKEVILLLLGEEQREKLYQHLEEKHGKAKTALVAMEIKDILSHLNDDKKK